jgi:ribonuclease HII
MSALDRGGAQGRVSVSLRLQPNKPRGYGARIMPWRAGIDENGLGPQLGPLIVTAALANVNEAARKRIECDGAAFLHERLNDSKALVRHGSVSLAEAWARAIVARSGTDASSPDALLQAIAPGDRATRVGGCLQSVFEQCWSDSDERFEASDEAIRLARGDLDALCDQGIELRGVRSAIVCVRELNVARREGTGRFDCDLHAMERLILAARADCGAELEAVCGKVGGLQKYIGAMSLLGDRLHVVLAQTRDCSSYRFPGIGTVHFRKDADGNDPLVALASLVGKWVRELLMRRIVRFYQRHEPGLTDASGYNDPVTDRFVRATRSLRNRLSIPMACFRREQGEQ